MKISLENNNKVWFYKVKTDDETYNETKPDGKNFFNTEKFAKRFNFNVEDFEKLNGKIKKAQMGDVFLMPPSSKYCHIVAPAETYNQILKTYGKEVCQTQSVNKKLFIGQKIFL